MARDAQGEGELTVPVRQRRGVPPLPRDLGRGLHSSTLQLNLSALHGIGGARVGVV